MSITKLAVTGCALASPISQTLMSRPRLLDCRPSSSAFPAPHLSLHHRPLSTALVAALPPVLDPRVVSTSVRASFNLFSLCGFVIVMQRFGHLPSNTAPVLSQVSFNLVIPCFLMSKVSQTLSLRQDWRFFTLPLVALIQIAIGGILGRLACICLYRKSSVLAPENQNTGLPPMEALITMACAFGNTVTLPLVFLNGMLSKSDYTVAAGYLALFMIGWSPCLWTIGYQVLNSTSGPPLGGLAKKDSKFSFRTLVDWLKRLMNPPLYGVLIGIFLGATPLSYLCLPAIKSKVVDHETKSYLLSIYRLIAGIFHSIVEGANLLGSATVPLQTIVLASTLAQSIGSKKNNKESFIARINGPRASSAESYTGDRSMLEGKAFWAITVIRLFFMPLISFPLLLAFQNLRWLPADPLSRLILLVVTAMPTAQNLVVMVQLHPNTRPFAGVLANLLVRQYLVSIASLTFWLPIFFSFLRLR